MHERTRRASVAFARSPTIGTMPDPARDVALIDRARRGDRTAFADLYRELYPVVYRYAYFHTRSVAEAEDTAADAFVKALEHVHTFRGDATQVRAWVMRIVRNVLVDRSRRARATTPLEDAPEPAGPDHSGTVVDNVALRLALQTLGDDQRSTIVLRFVSGLSGRETAAVLGKSEGAIEQLQRRGLAALSKIIGPRT